jgi:glucokinase
MFTLGTGVGGGIILDGRSVDGENSFGSELGHLVIDYHPDARLCAWGGGRGQLEAYASAPAVVARAQEALTNTPSSSLAARLQTGEALTPLMLAEEAEKGDPLSSEIILETARLLAVGIVNAVHTVDPGAVILGGAMNFGGNATKVGRGFLAEVRSEFQQLAYHNVAQNTTIDFAALGGDAGYIGAAGIGRARYEQGT